LLSLFVAGGVRPLKYVWRRATKPMLMSDMVQVLSS
jgi:hypothetical protein